MSTLYQRRRTGVRIVVTGDQGTGKSSLIVTFAAGKPVMDVPPVLDPTRLPKYLCPDGVPITIIDTSSCPEDNDKVAEELKRADTIVLTYACDRHETFESLSTFWLPHLRSLEVKVPIIVVACKLDLQQVNQQVSLEKVMQPVMQHFPEIETSITCSASKHLRVPDVFCYAQKSVLYPLGPLFCRSSKTLKTRYVRALKRIFILNDFDRDGSLSETELNNFLVKCFNDPVLRSQFADAMKVVQEKLNEGVNERGLTLTEFQCIHASLIENGFRETPWIVLRNFGYNDDIKLEDDQIPPLKRAPDQSVELTNEAVHFLKEIFVAFDVNCDGMLQPEELKELFSTAPENPWIGTPYEDVVDENAFRGLSLDAFLSKWAFMTLLDPTFSVENLIYIGYPYYPSSAIHVTRKRHLDRKEQQSRRNVFQCFVFGPRDAGKSALLKSFIRWPFPETYIPTNEDRYAVNVVDFAMGNKKYLVLKEIHEDGVRELLANKDSLASCDIAIFVHDKSNESSWKASSKLLVEIARHGEHTGFKVPCLIVAAKDDQYSFQMAVQESTRVSENMGVEAPIPISAMLGNLNNLFHRIVTAAEHPHLSIPKTEVGKNRKQYHCLHIPETEDENRRKLYHRLVNQTLMFVSVGAALAFVGVGACRIAGRNKYG